MGSGGGGTSTNTMTDIPRQFKPAYLALFNSLFAASRTAAGQPGYEQGFYDPYNVAGYDWSTGLPMQQGPDGTWSVPQDYGYNPADPDAVQGQPTPPTGQPQDGQQGQPPVQPQDYDPGDYGGAPFANPFGGTSGGAPPWMGAMGRVGVLPEALGPPIVGQAFQGPFNAPVHPLEQLGLLQRAQLGSDLQGVGNPVMQLGMNTLTGQYLHPDSNPYLQATIDRAIQPIVQQTTEQFLPQIASESLAGGHYMGSSRRGLIESQLLREAMSAIGNTAGQIASDNYNRERGMQMAAPQTIDEAIRLAQISPELMGQAGAGFRGMEQLNIEEQLRQYEESQMAPWRPLLPLIGGITGTNVGQMQTTSNPPNSFQSGILGALGGGAGGAAAGFGLSQAGAPWGGTAGALGGGALGAALGGLAGAFA